MNEAFPTLENTENPLETNKKRNQTIEIKVGEQIYSLETESYDFEYPKHIQEDTGIIGYERVKISKDNLNSLIQKGFNVVDLLEKLSGREYPNNCFTHQFAAAATSQKDLYIEEFVKSRFFIQKIYDMNTAKRIDAPFTNGIDGNKNLIEIFNKKTGISIGQSIFVSDINKEPYKELLESGEYFATTSGSGFGVGVGGFNKEVVELDFFDNKPGFGFSMRGGTFTKKYLEKSFEIYTKKLKGNMGKKISGPGTISYYGLAAILENMILMDDKIQNLFSEKKLVTIDEDIETAINNVEVKNNIKIESFFDMVGPFGKTDYLEKFKRDIKKKVEGSDWGLESKLPIFIGSDDIPQLSWGHADYAHYSNEKDFNFFKFKHTEKLPLKGNKF